MEAEPKCEGDGSQVERNRHIVHAVGKGDPQVYAGRADEPKFDVGDVVTVRETAGALLHPHPRIRARRYG